LLVFVVFLLVCLFVCFANYDLPFTTITPIARWRMSAKMVKDDEQGEGGEVGENGAPACDSRHEGGHGRKEQDEK
jgi:hypothetical protein